VSQEVAVDIVDLDFESFVRESIGLAQNEYFDIPCPQTPTNYIEDAPRYNIVHILIPYHLRS
jgi:hypothetical protein